MKIIQVARKIRFLDSNPWWNSLEGYWVRGLISGLMFGSLIMWLMSRG